MSLNCVSRVLAILVVFMAQHGCGLLDSCSNFQSRCDGTTLEYCQQNDPGSTWMVERECPGACVEYGDHQAVCTDSPTKVDACATDGYACWNNQTTLCQGGYPTQTSSCGAGTTCTVVPSCVLGAVCALGTASAACDPSTGDLMRTCDDTDIVSCACGFTLSKTSCGADTCALDDETMEPRCMPAS